MIIIFYHVYTISLGVYNSYFHIHVTLKITTKAYSTNEDNNRIYHNGSKIIWIYNHCASQGPNALQLSNPQEWDKHIEHISTLIWTHIICAIYYGP